MSIAQAKIKRLRDALGHRETDRVPAGEFFWTGFLKKAREKWGQDFDPYRRFDLDYIVVTPNMDPRIQPFEVVDQSGENIVVRTGFGATIRRRWRWCRSRCPRSGPGSSPEAPGASLPS